ncbi:hypothetical protein [Streptomyces flaveolus]|uniref:hypothetical protein n=1 Tax=Streptomyces flaveolus TaxID=67297 RepID=UPI0036FF5E13
MLHKAAALERRDHAPADDGTSPERLVLLICNEIQHVFLAAMAQPTGDLAHRLRWST